jgi:hypothetical protein
MQLLSTLLAHGFKLRRRLRQKTQGKVIDIGALLIDSAKKRSLGMLGAPFFHEQPAGVPAEINQLPLQLFIAADENLERFGDAVIIEWHVHLSLNLHWIHYRQRFVKVVCSSSAIAISMERTDGQWP